MIKMPNYFKEHESDLGDESVVYSEHGEKSVKSEKKFEEEFSPNPKKMDNKWKAILTILTIVGCISLILISARILDIDITGDISENKSPTVSISVDSTSSYLPIGVSFEIAADDPDGSIKSCIIDFGDGNTAQGYNFTHKYEEPGVYMVVVTVTDNKGNESSCNTSITIEESLTVSANADITSGIFPLTVSFTGLGEDVFGNITEYYWDFGDGNTSYEQNNTHIFEKAGKYTVTLTVSNDRGEKSSDNITITAKHRPYFKMSGKIVNNYNIKIDVDYAVVWNYGDWNYWAPTKSISPYEIEDFSFDVKTGNSSYIIWAQWFYPGTDDVGCEISELIFSNPSEKDVVYYIEIKSNGEIEISTTYHPPNPPKKPKIISQNAFVADGNTYVLGKIKNVDSLSIKDLEIEITLYDSSNNVISKSTVNPFVSLIGAKKTSSFFEEFWEDYFHHCTIEISSFKTTDEKPYNALLITDNYQEKDWFGDLHVKGTIKNTGSKVTKFVLVNGIFYDSEGKILWIKKNGLWGSTIYSGEEEMFDIEIYLFSELEMLPGTISSYELEIDYEL